MFKQTILKFVKCLKFLWNISKTKKLKSSLRTNQVTPPMSDVFVGNYLEKKNRFCFV